MFHIIELLKKLYSTYKILYDLYLKKQSRNIYSLSAKAFILACKQSFSGYKIFYNKKGIELKKAFRGIAFKLNLKTYNEILNANRKEELLRELKINKIIEVETQDGNTDDIALSAFYNSFYECFIDKFQDEILNNPYAEKRANLTNNTESLQNSEKLNNKLDKNTEKLCEKNDKNTKKIIQAIEKNKTNENSKSSNHEKLIVIRSYVRGTEESMKNACYSLDLSKYFNERIPINDDVWTKIQMEVIKFVKKLSNNEVYQLDASTHYSITYLLGILLDSKSGNKVKIKQRTSSLGIQQWEPVTYNLKEYNKFKVDERIIEQNSKDIAICVSITKNILSDVFEFITVNDIKVNKIVNYTLDDNIGNISVEDGQHAWRLAEQIKRDLDDRPLINREGNIHFFFAAPNGLVFFLGQMSFSLKNIHLYEFSNNAEPKNIYYRTFVIPKGEF